MGKWIVVEEFPNCCKAYILYRFPNDTQTEYPRIYSGSGTFIGRELISYTEEQIREDIRNELLNIIQDQWEYDELTLFASVTKCQMIAKEELLKFGFREVACTENPGSYDEVVYFMVKDLREGEDWFREDEYEEDYD